MIYSKLGTCEPRSELHIRLDREKIPYIEKKFGEIPTIHNSKWRFTQAYPALISPIGEIFVIPHFGRLKKLIFGMIEYPSLKEFKKSQEGDQND